MAEAALNAIRHCLRCGLPYDWRRSTSWSLKLTFCSESCERHQNGFTIEELLRCKREQWVWQPLDFSGLVPA